MIKFCVTRCEQSAKHYHLSLVVALAPTESAVSASGNITLELPKEQFSGDAAPQIGDEIEVDFGRLPVARLRAQALAEKERQQAEARAAAEREEAEKAQAEWERGRPERERQEAELAAKAAEQTALEAMAFATRMRNEAKQKSKES